MNALDLSVVICTRNRAASLKRTLECLRRADGGGLEFEVVVVENNSSDETSETVAAFQESLPLLHRLEPRPGKSHALNRAINDGLRGRIIAILDDDMSPQLGWFQGVMALSGRWPEHDFFTGRTPVIWPSDTLPGWALEPRIRAWAFSAEDWPRDRDAPIQAGRVPLGGHFWFRSRVLSDGRRFEHLWATEPQFTLQLAEDGFRGMRGPDAVAGHRIQPELLCEPILRRRAAQVGHAWARVRLPCRKQVKQGILLRKHPLLFRLFCALSVVRWSIMRIVAQLNLSRDKRIANTLVAIERTSNYLEMLRIAGQVEEGWRREDRKAVGGRL